MNIEALVNLSFISIILILFFIGIKYSSKAAEYRNFIEGCSVPSSILEKFHQYYPDLTTEQMEKVISGFKIFLCIVYTNPTTTLTPPTSPAPLPD